MYGKAVPFRQLHILLRLRLEQGEAEPQNKTDYLGEAQPFRTSGGRAGSDNPVKHHNEEEHLLLCGDVISGHLVRVTNQKLAAGNRRIVPRLAFDSSKPRDFGILLRRSFYQCQLTTIARHY